MNDDSTWDKQGAGLDPTHPAAQSFYNSQVDLYASWGVSTRRCFATHSHTQAQSISQSSALGSESVRGLAQVCVIRWT